MFFKPIPLALPLLFFCCAYAAADVYDRFGEEIKLDVDGELQIVTGDWVSGLHGCGVNWGDEKEGHSSTTLTLHVGDTIKVWYSKDKEGDRHVVALAVGDTVVAGRNAPRAEMIAPDETFELRAGCEIYLKIWTANDHPDIRRVQVRDKS